MIHLVGIEKSYYTTAGNKLILHETNISIPSHRRVGVLGRNGAGKTTLLEMIAGVEKPDRGTIIRDCKLSWPLGFVGGLHPDLTGFENIAFVSRLYDQNFEKMKVFVEDFSELGYDLKLPMRTYSSGMRAKLTFAISLAVDFDCYLIDELVGVGDRFFREKSRKAFLKRADHSGMLLVSHNETTIKKFCDLALVIHHGLLIPFSDVDTAIEFYLRKSEQ